LSRAVDDTVAVDNQAAGAADHQQAGLGAAHGGGEVVDRVQEVLVVAAGAAGADGRDEHVRVGGELLDRGDVIRVALHRSYAGRQVAARSSDADHLVSPADRLGGDPAADHATRAVDRDLHP
jgi:hypothetical protein